MKLPISVIILTYNEELNIEKCLLSIVDWASEIFIVDSLSTDKTLEITKKYGAKITKRPFRHQANQFNWALDNLKIKSEWILRLDADEEMTEELWREIASVLSGTPVDVSGFYIKRRVYFMGRWIRHGGYYPTWFLRLFRKGKARYEEREVDEHIVLLTGRTLKLEHDFIDNDKKGLERWISKQNNHSSRELQAMLRERGECLRVPAHLWGSEAEHKRWLKENIFLRAPLFLRAFFYFLYRYFFRLGFLDGREGLIFHFLSALWYRFLVDAKFYEYRKKQKLT